MKWITQILLDLAVTATVLAYAFWKPEWAWWVIAVYTPLLLLLKLLAFGAGGFTGPVRTRADAPPPWVHHLLYGTNVAALLLAPWLLLAAGWAAVWLLSVLAERAARARAAIAPAKARKR